MDWPTIIISVLGSGVLAAIVTGLSNYYTNIRAIKESGLFSKRADVLDTMLKAMVRLDLAMKTMVSPVQVQNKQDDEQNRRVEALESLSLFENVFFESEHYLPEQLSFEVKSLCAQYKALFVSFAFEARLPNENPNIEKWFELESRLKTELEQKRQELIGEFRVMLGVKNKRCVVCV
jgi:hypothetical protein